MNTNRDTDDVRIATSLNMGMLLQFILTFIVTLVLAFKRSPTLTLVILSSIPLMVIVQFFTQLFSFRFLTTERNSSANASTTIDRAIASIATVKAFNAQTFEEARANYAINQMRRAARSCAAVWGISFGFSGFIMFGMFVQGFWYGSKLVREGQISPGDVLAVFWSCLIASSSMQMTIPLLVIYTRGKSAMASLMALVNPPPSQPRRSSSTYRPIASDTPKSPFSFTHKFGHRKPVPLQKIKPASCKGAFDLRNVTFSYPSRPDMPVLEDISIYLPDSDTTFIVGGSGSGKSTLAQLLLRLYEPDAGEILLDEQDFFHLDTEWTRSHIAAVSQGCILFDMTVHDNVAMGLAGSDSGRKPSDATREEVIAACRSALMHDFVRDLPDGYDTLLGNGGANLSGGQKQRLAIARVFMRNPTVLILGE
jgi:ATP-binding cassette subfamily B (MDR/TAP) protein 1